jgi:hypothetical protein
LVSKVIEVVPPLPLIGDPGAVDGLVDLGVADHAGLGFVNQHAHDPEGVAADRRDPVERVAAAEDAQRSRLPRHLDDVLGPLAQQHRAKVVVVRVALAAGVGHQLEGAAGLRRL